MRIAYVTTYDASNVRNWSGTPYFIARALEKHGATIYYIGPLKTFTHFYFRVKQMCYNKFFKKIYQIEREPFVTKYWAWQIQKKINKLDVDLVLCPGTTPICNLETKIPVVFYTDSPFGSLTGAYLNNRKLCNETIKEGEIAEQKAHNIVRLAIYSSDWAAGFAKKRYNVCPSKVKVVPFGANIEIEYDDERIENAIINRDVDECRLLFLGVDWKRKGGDTAFEVAKLLYKTGIKTKLIVVGCSPSFTEPYPEFLKVVGFLDKSTPTGKQTLAELLLTSHFLILPTQAEAYGLAFCEANAHGLPCLGTNLMGIPTIIRNGVNGFLFSPNASADEYYKTIARLHRAPDEYRSLCRSSFREYKTRLNWNVAAKTLVHLFEQITITHCSEA